jgi:hypothetical protein
MPSSDDARAEDAGGTVYVYKPSLMGAPFEFRLAPDALEWRKGGYSGRTPYNHIRRIRLSFRPMTMQSYRFVTEVWPLQGPKMTIASTSWKSIVEQERLDAAYGRFVTELSRRVGAAGGTPLLQTGAPALLYWLGLALFIGALLAMAALIVRALQLQSWSGAAFIAAFLALSLWQIGSFFGRNRPGVFRADAVPPKVLPKAS